MTDSPMSLSMLRKFADPVMRGLIDHLDARLNELERRVTQLEHTVALLRSTTTPPTRIDTTKVGSQLSPHHCACGENTLPTESAVVWQYNGKRVHTVRRCGKTCDHGHFTYADQCPECT